VARISTAVGKAPAALFLNIAERARRRARVARKRVEGVFKDEMEAWRGERERNNAMLKPSLGNSNARAELDALCAAEAERLGRALRRTRETMEECLAVEAQESWALLSEMQHAAGALLALLDAVAAPADLVPTDEDVVAVRKMLLTLLREQAKSASGAGEKAIPPGKAFPVREWRGLRQGELGPAAVLAVAEQIERDSSVTAKQVVAQLSAELGAPLSSNDTANHETAVKLRDRVYNQFRLGFVSQVERTIRAYKAIEREELRWQSNWNTLVESLKES